MCNLIPVKESPEELAALTKPQAITVDAVERVAKAIHDSNPELRYGDDGKRRDTTWQEVQGGANYYRDLAKAAIAAMQPRTDAVLMEAAKVALSEIREIDKSAEAMMTGRHSYLNSIRGYCRNAIYALQAAGVKGGE